MTTARVTGALGALAQETRLALFRLLVERGPNGLPAGAIAERVGVPPSSLSFHLRSLQHAGLITPRRLGRQVIYAADFAAINALVRYLTENCCGSSEAYVAVCRPGRALARGDSGHGAPARARRR